MLAQQGFSGLSITTLCALDEKVVVISCDTTRVISSYLAEVKLRSDNAPLNGLLLLQVVLRPASRSNNNT